MTHSNEPVGVLGGGSWGTTLAQLSAIAGRDVLLWVRDSDLANSVNSKHKNKKYWPKTELDTKIRATTDMAEVADYAKFIIAAIPSHAFRNSIRLVGDNLQGDHVIVHATKGIEIEGLKRMSEIIREETPVKRLGVLSGPNLADEIMSGQPSATVVASKYPEVVERAQGALVSSMFRVYGSSDLVGVEMGGALKNIIAICAGIIRGQGLGDNTMAMLITRGAAEISRFGVKLGATPETFAGLSGIGDLITTCASSLSRNHQVGARLGKGEKLDDILGSLNRVAEGVKTTKAVYELAGKMNIDMPITRGVYGILYKDTTPADLREMLMTRSAKYENNRY